MAWVIMPADNVAYVVQSFNDGACVDGASIFAVGFEILKADVLGIRRRRGKGWGGVWKC